MRLYRCFFLLVFSAISVFGAGPTNSILFVTQVQIPADFTTIASAFGNHLPTLESCGRGGDLYIRYPDGTIRNLTRAAGFGRTGAQDGTGIAVRQPSVHWSGTKAIFSMVVGAPRYQFDYDTVSYWQLYEITNFLDTNSLPVIAKVANQPTNFNNISPIYGSDDRIIFTSDRPRNGEAQLYPQLDEYEEAPTVTGLWSLQPTNGDLFMINHTPSGAFSPIIDSAGRIIFTRWDHLQRDQQADTDWEHGDNEYGAFNWSDESSNSVMTTDQTEVFPEPRTPRTDLLAGTYLYGNDFNQFFPWAINQDGTDEETLNHIGRHEIGGSYRNLSFTNDPNIFSYYNFTTNYNKNIVNNFLYPREDPNTPGLFYGIDAPEFASHGGGQIVSITGATNLNAYYMQVNYLTPRSTSGAYNDASDVPTNHSGFYRSPLMTTDGYLIASHTTNALATDVLVTNAPDTNGVPMEFDYRLKFLQLSNGYYVPGATLTSGLTNDVTFWNPDELVSITNQLWEFDPVEVVARPRPVPYEVSLDKPELAAFAAAKVDVSTFQNYLKTHQLALIVSRDVTTRDQADRQQPFNLHISGTAHQTIGTPGKIYDIAYLQLFQADQLRSLNKGNPNNPGTGRRVIAQYLHDPATDNPALANGLPGTTQLGTDGSSASIVPARRALSWQLTDTNGVGIVRERYWLTMAPGEIRSCTSCHGINEKDQAGNPTPTNTPVALIQLLNYWKTNATLKTGMAANAGTNYFQITFVRRPAEVGVTYHVQASTNALQWLDIATYSGTNIVLSAQAAEISRVGSPNESVTVRDLTGMAKQSARFLRINVTRP